MVDLVLGEYQVIGLVDLVDREGLDLLTDLLPLLVPMEGQSLWDFVLGFFSEEVPLS